MPEIPIATQIDRFHVPFIIYSPMLKRVQHFKGVSSHFDVTPTLLSLLNKHFKLKTPSTVQWLGSGLDTSHTFRSLHSIPLMPNKNELVDYLDKDYYIANGVLYKLEEYMHMEMSTNKATQQEVMAVFNEFKQRNKIACSNNKLIPDSLKLK
jgi:uncharacterized sulfatase